MIDGRVDPSALDPETLLSEWQRECPELETVSKDASLDQVAAILAAAHPQLNATEMEAELRDRVRIEMTNAVIDVETLARDVQLEHSEDELRRRVAGEEPMTLGEYAHLRYTIARRRD